MTTSESPDADDPQAIVRNVFARVRARDAAVADLYAENAVITLADVEHRGRPAIAAFYQEVFRNAQPQPQVRGIWVNGDQLVVLLEVTSGGRLMHTIDLFHVTNGAIDRMRLFTGSLEVGWVPLPVESS